MKGKMIVGAFVLLPFLFTACVTTDLESQWNTFTESPAFIPTVAGASALVGGILLVSAIISGRKGQTQAAQQEEARRQQQMDEIMRQQQQAQEQQTLQQQAQQQQEEARQQQLQQARQAARELTFGTAVSVNLPSGGEQWFSVRTTSNVSFTVETTGNIDTRLEAYDESNNRIARDDDSGQGRNARLQINAQAGRTYFFRVNGYDNAASGPYSIMAQTAAQQEEARRQQQLAQQQQQQQAQQQQEEARRQQQQQQQEVETRLQQSGAAFSVRQNTDNTLTITGFNRSREYENTRTTVTIPSTIQGLRVTVIGSNVFHYYLDGIEFPNTIVTIEPKAFSRDDSPPGIGMSRAPASLNRLGSVRIPNSVTSIGSYAFRYSEITSLSLGTGVQTIDTMAFANNSIRELVLPASLRTVGENAFYSCGIQTLVIPASLAAGGIRQNAFIRNSISRITVPANMSNSYFTGSTAIGLPQGFSNFYISQNRAAGTYVLRGQIWSRE